MAQLFLIGCGLVLAWAVSLYFWPFAPCRKCGGTGTNRGSNARRFGQCKRCDGTRMRQRPGSRVVHRTARDAAAYRRRRR